MVCGVECQLADRLVRSCTAHRCLDPVSHRGVSRSYVGQCDGRVKVFDTRHTRKALSSFVGSERRQPVHSLCCAPTTGARDLVLCGTMGGVYAGIAPTPDATG